MTTKQYKQHKGLKTESLRDNMTNLELQTGKKVVSELNANKIKPIQE